MPACIFNLDATASLLLPRHAGIHVALCPLDARRVEVVALSMSGNVTLQIAVAQTRSRHRFLAAAPAGWDTIRPPAATGTAAIHVCVSAASRSVFGPAVTPLAPSDPA